MEVKDIIYDLKRGKDVILFANHLEMGLEMLDSMMYHNKDHHYLLNKIKVKSYWKLLHNYGERFNGLENTSFYYHPKLLKVQNMLMDMLELLNPYLQFVEIIIKDGIIRVNVLDEDFPHQNYNMVGIDPFPKGSHELTAFKCYNLVFECMLESLKEEYGNEN